MKSDLEIQKDVMNELAWDPVLNAAEIGVAVKDGVVNLSGVVDRYAKKLAAEKAAKKIAGVKAVAQEIQVSVSCGDCRNDFEIAHSIVQSLNWHSLVDADNIKVKVEDGVVTLDGEVECNYQRESAENAVTGLTGVREIFNFLKIKPKTLVPIDVKQKIAAAFHRSATIDSKKIKVEIDGTTVILSGIVDSHAEKEDAYYGAWQAPGVSAVINNIRIAEEEYSYAID